MFFDILTKLCEENNVKLSPLLDDLGMSRGNIGKWRNGIVPSANSLKKIGIYFNVSVDYLLGNDIEKSPSRKSDEHNSNIIKIAGRNGSFCEKTLSDEQIELIMRMIEHLPDADDTL